VATGSSHRLIARREWITAFAATGHGQDRRLGAEERGTQSAVTGNADRPAERHEGICRADAVNDLDRAPRVVSGGRADGPLESYRLGGGGAGTPVLNVFWIEVGAGRLGPNSDQQVGRTAIERRTVDQQVADVAQQRGRIDYVKAAARLCGSGPPTGRRHSAGGPLRAR
jgi:hypothetical protein